MIDNEIWKPVVGYEDLYEVSNLGRARSLDRTVNSGIKHSDKVVKKGKILKASLNSSGYLYLNLWRQRKNKKYRVHRLVAEAFLPNPEGLPQVNHKNENKTDNRVENLEWCSNKYNMNYGTARERMCKKRRKPCGQYKNGVLIETFSHSKEAYKKTGVWWVNINTCCQGKRKTAGGYEWRYV